MYSWIKIVCTAQGMTYYLFLTRNINFTIKNKVIFYYVDPLGFICVLKQNINLQRQTLKNGREDGEQAENLPLPSP